jgi:hypothetical protein
MIQSIISVFEEQARQHKIIRSFHYHRNYAMGGGNEIHPLFWLEDPVSGRNQNNTFVNSANFSILFIPKRDAQVPGLQNLAFSVGLNMLEHIRQDKDSPLGLLPDWTYMTLRDYYDNNACGCRFSTDFTHRNTQNRCLLEAPFDKDKTFDGNALFKNFDLNSNENSNTTAAQLPEFDLHPLGL